jgi:H/ACA ribonucleoprotein complex subunit 4
MAELRRTRVGRFDERFLVNIHDLETAYLDWLDGKNENIRDLIMPVEAAIEHVKTIIVKDSAIASLVNGSPLYTAGLSLVEKSITRSDLVALMSHKGELVAIASSSMHALEMKKRRGVAASVKRVFMEKGVYN